jgi:hypothetical protein
LLRKSDPVLAEYSLKQAREDWEFAMSGMSERQRGAATEMAGHAACAIRIPATRMRRWSL